MNPLSTASLALTAANTSP